MKKISRRDFMKLGVLTTGVAMLSGKILPSAQAADCDDSKVNQQGYVSDHLGIDAKHKDYAKFSSNVKQLEDAATKAGKSTKNLHPHCGNCKQYKEKAPGSGCGTCPMVGANGSPGKMVKTTGWCRVYMADASKLK